ncbi:hypothetical protein [Flexibacterium corallicola]|uniref:hypothetical protein n=1 Tax=Flexibacterium corallicola TaxID=3037259 RepID=UPI00286F7E87|nr:hypothetical protein [Pseudovibrio sp. M1P-2-3]
MGKFNLSLFIEQLKSAEISTEAELVEAACNSDPAKTDYVSGWISNQLKIDQVTITYQNTFGHPVGNLSSIETFEEGEDETWIIDNNLVVVDDKAMLTTDDIKEIIALYTSIKSFDYSVLSTETFRRRYTQ